jgi:chitin disaccharide deacetylase
MPQFQLIVNADDFGFTRGVNDGIAEAHRNGILTATTLMAGGAAFDHAVELARATPSLDVGVHLVLWDESAGLRDESAGLGEKSGRLPQRLPAFVLRAMTMSPAAIEALFSAQVERVMQAGIVPSHLDTHKHTHTLPHVMWAMERTARRFGVTWIRRSLLSSWLPSLSPGSRPSHAGGLRSTDHFLGLGLTGKMTRESLAAELRRIRPGLTELMCHPGVYDAALESSPTRLKRQRQMELDALTAPEIRAGLAANAIELTSYRALSQLVP